jgi:hypothetical protein
MGHRLGDALAPAVPHVNSNLNKSVLRITRNTAPCTMRASSADGTDHRADGTSNAGIIWRAVPRAVPRPDCSALDNLLAGNAPTNQLLEVRPHASSVLPARMTQIMALMALTALGLSGSPVHEPVHG